MRREFWTIIWLGWSFSHQACTFIYHKSAASSPLSTTRYQRLCKRWVVMRRSSFCFQVMWSEAARSGSPLVTCATDREANSSCRSDVFRGSFCCVRWWGSCNRAGNTLPLIGITPDRGSCGTQHPLFSRKWLTIGMMGASKTEQICELTTSDPPAELKDAFIVTRSSKGSLKFRPDANPQDRLWSQTHYKGLTTLKVNEKDWSQISVRIKKEYCTLSEHFMQSSRSRNLAIIGSVAEKDERLKDETSNIFRNDAASKGRHAPACVSLEIMRKLQRKTSQHWHLTFQETRLRLAKRKLETLCARGEHRTNEWRTKILRFHAHEMCE